MQTPQITHDEYCRVFGELLLHAHIRIAYLQEQASSTNPLPLIQSLQQQIAKLQQENTILSATIESKDEEIGSLKSRLP